MITLLVTGAGAPGIAGTIYSLRNNPRGRPFRIVSVDIKDGAVGRFLSDAFYQVPPPEDAVYIPVLKEIALREKVIVIIPQTTREIIALSEKKDFFGGHGIRVLVSSPEKIALANNKCAILGAAQACGVPHPRHYKIRTEAEFLPALHRLGYPEKKAVIKPPVSNGMRGFRIIADSAPDLNKFLSEKPDASQMDPEGLLKTLRAGNWPELLMTEYLPGPEYSVDVFRSGDRILAVPRLRAGIRDGITFHARVEMRADLLKYSTDLAREIGLEYCFGFQFKLSEDGTPKLLECNPRVQGTMVVSTFAGCNMIYHSVMEALGEKTDLEGVNIIDGLEFKRFWGGLAVQDETFIGSI